VCLKHAQPLHLLVAGQSLLQVCCQLTRDHLLQLVVKRSTRLLKPNLRQQVEAQQQ